MHDIDRALFEAEAEAQAEAEIYGESSRELGGVGGQ